MRGRRIGGLDDDSPVTRGKTARNGQATLLCLKQRLSCSNGAFPCRVCSCCSHGSRPEVRHTPLPYVLPLPSRWPRSPIFWRLGDDLSAKIAAHPGTDQHSDGGTTGTWRWRWKVSGVFSAPFGVLRSERKEGRLCPWKEEQTVPFFSKTAPFLAAGRRLGTRRTASVGGRQHLEVRGLSFPSRYLHLSLIVHCLSLLFLTFSLPFRDLSLPLSLPFATAFPCVFYDFL